MQSLEVFLTRLLPKVQGCPEPAAFTALLDAATDFSDRTRAVRVTTDPVPLQAGVAEYDLDLPPGTEPAMFVRAWVGLRPIALPAEAHRGILGANTATVETGAVLALMPGVDTTVRLLPVPDRSGGLLTVRLALRPTATATQVMDVLYTRWREAIVGGAAARLASMPGKAFSNPAIATEGWAMFTRGVSDARVEANRDLVPGALRVMGEPFA